VATTATTDDRDDRNSLIRAVGNFREGGGRLCHFGEFRTLASTTKKPGDRTPVTDRTFPRHLNGKSPAGCGRRWSRPSRFPLKTRCVGESRANCRHTAMFETVRAFTRPPASVEFCANTTSWTSSLGKCTLDVVASSFRLRLRTSGRSFAAWPALNELVVGRSNVTSQVAILTGGRQ